MDNVLLEGTEVQQSSKVRTAVLYESSKDHQSRAKHMLAKVQQHSSKVHAAVECLHISDSRTQALGMAQRMAASCGVPQPADIV